MGDGLTASPFVGRTYAVMRNDCPGMQREDMQGDVGLCVALFDVTCQPVELKWLGPQPR